MNIVNINGNTEAEKAMFVLRYLVAPTEMSMVSNVGLRHVLSVAVDNVLNAAAVALVHPNNTYTVKLSTRDSPQPNTTLFVCALVHADTGETEVELQETVFYEE